LSGPALCRGGWAEGPIGEEGIGPSRKAKGPDTCQQRKRNGRIKTFANTVKGTCRESTTKTPPKPQTPVTPRRDCTVVEISGDEEFNE
jgi:hypothetical protein